MEAYIGEIRMFSASFAPDGWLPCDGRILKAADYQPLLSLIGNAYGGNGSSDFALPNLNGRVPIGFGKGPGSATTYERGKAGGSESIALTEAQIPHHAHLPQATKLLATASVPGPGLLMAKTVDDVRTYNNMSVPGTGDAYFSPQAIGTSGSGAAHDNMMPCMGMFYMICTMGIYPAPA